MVLPINVSGIVDRVLTLRRAIKEKTIELYSSVPYDLHVLVHLKKSYRRLKAPVKRGYNLFLTCKHYFEYAIYSANKSHTFFVNSHSLAKNIYIMKGQNCDYGSSRYTRWYKVSNPSSAMKHMQKGLN